MTIKDLKPAVVWNNFYGLTRCPRPSKHEEIVRQHLLDWAKERGIEAFKDGGEGAQSRGVCRRDRQCDYARPRHPRF